MSSLRVCLLVLALFVSCASLGCFGTPQQAVIDLPPKEPLTVEEWKSLPVEEKYESYTFDRLRLNDSQLKSENAWDKFMREVIVPERKKDIPL